MQPAVHALHQATQSDLTVADYATVNQIRGAIERGAYNPDDMSAWNTWLNHSRQAHRRMMREMGGIPDSEENEGYMALQFPGGLPGGQPNYIGQPAAQPMASEPTGFAQLRAEKEHLPVPDYVGGQYVPTPQQQPNAQQVAEMRQEQAAQQENQNYGQYQAPGEYHPADETPASELLGQPATQRDPSLAAAAQQGQQFNNPMEAVQHSIETLRSQSPDLPGATQQHAVNQVGAPTSAQFETPEQRAAREQQQREAGVNPVNPMAAQQAQGMQQQEQRGEQQQQAAQQDWNEQKQELQQERNS
jgi:hypothetical protein